MRIFITGGTGVLGRRLLKNLQARVTRFWPRCEVPRGRHWFVHLAANRCRQIFSMRMPLRGLRKGPKSLFMPRPQFPQKRRAVREIRR